MMENLLIYVNQSKKSICLKIFEKEKKAFLLLVSDDDISVEEEIP